MRYFHRHRPRNMVATNSTLHVRRLANAQVVEIVVN